MSLSIPVFGFALLDSVALLMISIFNVITLSDLEIDVINVQQGCSKLNKTFVPELVLHGIITVLLFLNNSWFVFLFNIIMDFWLVYKCFKRQPGQLGFYDPLEINNRKSIKKQSTICLIRLMFYLICFFAYLFLFIHALL